MGRFIIILTLATVVGASATDQVRGQQGPGIVSLSDSSFESSDSSPQTTHAGLVGKRYFEARYLHLRSTDSAGFNESVQGFDVTFNTPVPWTDQLIPGLGTDAFINYERLATSESTFGGSVDLTLQTVEGGLTLHGAFESPIRPFLQVGAMHMVTEVDFSSSAFSSDFAMNHTRVLARPGIEFDIDQDVAIRSTLDIDTEDRFNDSTAGIELIVGLDHNAYLRGGVLIPLEGRAYIIAIGGGLSF